MALLIVSSNPTAEAEGTSPSEVLEKVTPYICNDGGCAMDPVNLLFVNIDATSSEDAAEHVQDALHNLDGQWGRFALSGDMSFEINGVRHLAQEDMKDYTGVIGVSDAWHVRFAGSPGCDSGDARPCYVLGAAHYDDLLYGSGCGVLRPTDVSYDYTATRKRIRATFAGETGYDVAELPFPNTNVVAQGCPSDDIGPPGLEDNRESGEVTVIDFNENKEFAFSLPSSENVEVMLIIDSSGSMSTTDPNNLRRAAGRAYLAASVRNDRVGVVDFDDTAKLAQGLSSIPKFAEKLVTAVFSIDSSGGTNIRAGIEEACKHLKENGLADKRGAILLTDGGHNVGAFGDPQECFADRGWPIFTFGFGGADQTLLQTVADDTGGEFAFIPTSDLVCEFQRVRVLIAGEQPGPCTAQHVNLGETTSTAVAVPPGQSQATFSTSWCCSDIVMTLKLPSGRVIDRNTNDPDVVHDYGPTFEIYTIINPEPGEWEINLFGADLSTGGEDAVFGFTTIAAPEDLCPADVDGDQDVTIFDFFEVLNAMGSTPSSSNWNPDADIDLSGRVNWLDLIGVMKSLLNGGCDGGSPPDPDDFELGD